ncbi:hypothetical protein LINGRAHAP2_LOCUS22278 [Linum grandiflorum]
MGKLASAREHRMYGPRLSRNRGEYVNAGLYLFATIVLVCGFVAQFSREPRSGLVLLLIALLIVVAVSVHDMVAHLAGIDYRLPSLMVFDPQLALVEFAVPLLLAAGALLCVQEEKGYGMESVEGHAVKMVVAGTALWLLGSINNVCQIYERADAHVQILQQAVQLPFLMGSLLFLVGAIINIREQSKRDNHGLHLLGRSLLWMSIYGSVMFFVGGLANVVKVFKMQQMNGGLRLEKLRGGANERLIHARDAHLPLIINNNNNNEQHQTPRHYQEQQQPPTAATPYKDVLLRHQP